MNKKIATQTSPFGPLLEKKSDIETNVLVKSDIEDFFDVKHASEIQEDSLKRYIEVTSREFHMPLGLAKTYSEIYSRIMTPLFRAKKNYCMCQYTESILLSALSVEMLVLLVWKIYPCEKSLSDKDFDDLGLEKKIDKLFDEKIIPEFIKTKMHSVRKTRNKYAHIWKDFSRIEKGDARRCFLYAMEMFARVAKVSLKVVNGEQRVDVNPFLLNFLKDLS
jgi:hypothetical protein